jgi:hypothetical protein
MGTLCTSQILATAVHVARRERKEKKEYERKKTTEADRSTRREAHPHTSPYDENEPDGPRP